MRGEVLYVQLGSRGEYLPVAPVSLVSPVGSLSLEKKRDLIYYVYQAATLVRATTYGLCCAGCRIKSSFILFYQTDNVRKMSLFSSLLLLFNGSLDEAMIEI
jgi:hypothetical protein